MKTKKLEGKWSYEALAKAVLDHALANYSRGWDEVVECLSPKEIIAELRARKIWSLGGAIRLFQAQIQIRKEAMMNTEAHLHKNY